MRISAHSARVHPPKIAHALLTLTTIASAGTLASPLLHPSGAIGDQFGHSLAVSGDTLLVGADWDDVGANINHGSAHIYRRNGNDWTYEATLTALDGSGGDRFGESVALSGDTALVGAPRDHVAPNDEQGSAYVFVRTGTTWTQQARLTAADGSEYVHFGGAVALSGDTALVGAAADDVGIHADCGSAYVFVRSGMTWTQQAKLISADGAAFDRFGISVALADDTALVGAFTDTTGSMINHGSAYVFVRSGAVWTQQAKLTAGDSAASDYFGISVALSGENALIGADGDDIGANTDQGSAYIFTRSGTIWTQQSKLTADDGAAHDQLGDSVSLSGDTALIAAPFDDMDATVNQGSVYLYARTGATWSQPTRLAASDGAANDQFGFSIALAENTALIGAPTDDIEANADQGSVWAFQVPPPCPGDANGDNIANSADLSVLLSNFNQPAVGPGFGDFNGDGNCDGADLSVLLGVFGHAC